MQHTHRETGLDWREALFVSFGLGGASILDFEWIIDRAERGEWGGLWW